MAAGGENSVGTRPSVPSGIVVATSYPILALTGGVLAVLPAVAYRR
ncbi:hypothetical protein ACFXI6_49435 [Streptomyces mirabilis]